jgi:hypothetical protein
MKLVAIFRGSVVALASIGLLLPQLALGAGTVQPNRSVLSTVVRDVALQEDGLLKGQVLDTEGTPVPGIPVVIARQGKRIATTETGADGSFAVTGLGGGVYQIVTAQGGAAYRLWAPRTAPPAAATNALIVNGDTVVRGGMGGGAAGFLSNPWVLGTIVALAIVLPLASDDDDDAS